MNNLDRKKAPKIHTVEKVVLPEVERAFLDNGIPVFLINMGKIDGVRIEIIFNAGRPYEHKPTVSRATAALLKEGTKSWKSSEIAETFDFYGGSISSPMVMDTTSALMYSLNKYVDNLLPVFAEIICEPVFPQKELDTFIENCIQDLQIELSKPEVLVYRKLTESIFGATHPYGYNSDENSYKNLTINDLKQHHSSHYHAGNTTITVSGKLEKDILQKLNRYFGHWQTKLPSIPNYPTINIEKPKQIFIPKPDAAQTAIAIGHKLFNRTHEDYAGMFLLNTILGGYFGSRLMTNIREEKGYTYNISSSIEISANDGYFHVATEVGNDFTAVTLQEIYQEIEILQNDLVSNSELKMVRNYILGNMLNLVDGPFNVADVYKTYISENIDYQHFNQFVEDLKMINAKQIRDLAQRYLASDNLWEVIAGVKLA